MELPRKQIHLLLIGALAQILDGKSSEPRRTSEPNRHAILSRASPNKLRRLRVTPAHFGHKDAWGHGSHSTAVGVL